MNNPYLKHLRDYHITLSDLQGQAFQIGTYLKNYTKTLLKRPPGEDYLLSTLYFTDITSTEEGRFFPRDYYISNNDNVEEFVADILVMVNNAIIAHSYERFISFLKDVITEILLRDRTIAEPSVKFSPTEELDFKTVREKLNEVRMKNTDRLRVLRQYSAEYKKYETQNNYRINFCEWLDAVTKARDAITHSSSLIDKSTVEGLGPNKLKSLELYFQLQELDDEYRLISEIDDVRHFIRNCSEFSFLVFKSLSMKDNYEWSVYEIRK
ncbi:hypothetical protein D770_16810 [Flammeovirgaceae bacterium 311]|nr:hypothetical protein D770_16810 [Flammeovirgaceae bacterium 311]